MKPKTEVKGRKVIMTFDSEEDAIAFAQAQIELMSKLEKMAPEESKKLKESLEYFGSTDFKRDLESLLE